MKFPPLPFAALLLAGCFFLAASVSTVRARPADGPIRVLFLGHEKEHHNSNAYYPMLAQALGRDAIYFDYVTSVEEAMGDADYLDHFDAVLLYANHDVITQEQWKNLKGFVENGGGFVPVHCASGCFTSNPDYIALLGGQFARHQTAVFKTKIVAPDHPAMRGVSEFEAWDETYVHQNHNETNRTVLMVREPQGPDDNITAPEPWTWVRTEGKGRVFYTASGHDERTWSRPEFHALLKSGILWAVGDARRAAYEKFLSERQPLTYEKRDNIPNYEERPEPLPYQHPLPPEESLKYVQAPVGFHLELFAAEPQVINPICMAWDERGRLWVAETVDYPNEMFDGQHGHDTIKILEDTDGDGRADKVTTFAEGLNIPTSIVFANGGVIVAQAPDFLFLEDTDGDGVADVKTVFMEGWGTRDTHAGPSNLRWGFDNWIWGTVGYSGFEGTVGGKAHKFGMGIFRMKPDGSEIEFLHQFNNNTWGLGFNAAGDAFGSTANNNPSFFGGLRATVFPEGANGMSAKMIADTPVFHPITPNIRQVDCLGAYTAGCGHALASSAAFPESYRDRTVFVNGPTGDLTGRFELVRQGAGYVAKSGPSFLAGADEWFSPVSAEVGPDGNLWVADWYNFIIQHNPAPKMERGGYDAELGKGNAHVNPNRDREHGRIYRVIWEKAPTPAIASLADATDAQLLAALDSDNQFWRLTAQRLLVQGNREATTEALKQKVAAGGVGAIHALWTLDGLGQLDPATHQLALLSPDPALRRNGIRALGTDEASMQLLFDTAVITDSDLLVRLAAFEKMAQFPKSDAVKLAASQLMKDPMNREDEWLLEALRAIGTRQGGLGPGKLGPNLLPNPSFEELTDTGEPRGWKVRTYKGKAGHDLDTKIAHSGAHALRIQSEDGADTSWFAKVEVEPDTDYRLSGWIRTQGLSGARGALLNVHEIQGENHARTRALTKRNDWTEVEVFFNSGNHKKLSINALFGGWGTATGAAWWDDVSLQKVTYGDPAAALLSEADPGRGRKIFYEHAIAACIRCHTLNGAGGPIGPPLDGIATRKDEAYIRESLTDPGAKIAEGFQAEVSPMPPMGVLLKPQEFEDVVAFLETLK